VHKNGMIEVEYGAVKTGKENGFTLETTKLMSVSHDFAHESAEKPVKSSEEYTTEL
jgi:hypothetical protein